MTKDQASALIKEWLVWRMDLDIEARIQSIQERNEALMTVGIVFSMPPGPRIPKGVDFTANRAELLKMNDVIAQMPIVPRLVLMAHYWPVREDKWRDYLGQMGLTNGDYFRKLDKAIEFVQAAMGHTLNGKLHARTGNEAVPLASHERQAPKKSKAVFLRAQGKV